MELTKAIVETFTHRDTNFNDIAAFEKGFTEDTTRQRRWRTFIKKKKALVEVEFEEVIQLLKKLLTPIVGAIYKNEEFEQKWNKATKSWM